jgi:hypothetical protein
MFYRGFPTGNVLSGMFYQEFPLSEIFYRGFPIGDFL